MADASFVCPSSELNPSRSMERLVDSVPITSTQSSRIVKVLSGLAQTVAFVASIRTHRVSNQLVTTATATLCARFFKPRTVEPLPAQIVVCLFTTVIPKPGYRLLNSAATSFIRLVKTNRNDCWSLPRVVFMSPQIRPRIQSPSLLRDLNQVRELLMRLVALEQLLNFADQPTSQSTDVVSSVSTTAGAAWSGPMALEVAAKSSVFWRMATPGS